MPEMYEPSNGGQEYNVPLDGDVADAPLAFKNFSESMPPEYVPVKDLPASYEVVSADNGKILVASSDSDVTFAGDLPEGFNVALTLSASGTITLNGVVGEESIPFEKIGSVVKAGGVLYSSVSIGEIIEVEGASGGPTAPTSITVNGSVVTSGPAGEGDAGPPIAYGAKVTSELEGDTFTWELEQPADPILNGPEVTLSGTTAFVNYQVEIFGLNVAGRGEGIVSEKFQLNYNKASGGTPQTGNTDPEYPGADIVDNYNGTTEKWAVHTFTASDATGLTVLEAYKDFRVLVVGGGGGAGGTTGGYTGGLGGGGGTYSDDFFSIAPQTVPVTVGTGGYPTSHNTWVKSSNSSIVVDGTTITAGGGAGGGSGPDGGGSAPAGTGAGGGTNGFGGGSGSGPGRNCNGGWQASGANLVSTISGTSQTYSVVGGHAKPNQGGSAGCNNGSRGASGVVIVAYQIGMSTTREIAQAQAEQEARAAGVEEGLKQGIEQGKVEGYAQAQGDLAEVIEAGRTALQAAVEQDTMIIDGKEQPVKRRRRK